MDKRQVRGDLAHQTWEKLIKDFSLTPQQRDLFERYATLLVEWNKKFNLTAILEPEKIVQAHFYDSLKIADFINFNEIFAVADVGTGAGFPGIPLKIVYPHLKVVLIEVSSKKRTFLEYISKEFGLDNVVVVGDDWRTFLRKTSYKIDYFFARASLQPEELVRIFKSNSLYNNALLVYWASKQWASGKQEARFVKKEVAYTLDDVQRKYVFFAQ